MTIDNVTSFVGPPGTPPTDTLETHFGSDAWMLRMCAQWRAERARQEKNWAEHDVAAGWGYLKDQDLDTDPLERMAALQYHIGNFKPRTALLACELLHVCTTILARRKEDPEHVMAHGPILKIIRNVVEALRSLEGNTRIGPKVPQEPAA